MFIRWGDDSDDDMGATISKQRKNLTAGESTPTPAYVVFEKLSFSLGDAWSFFFHGDILAALGALLPASPHQIGTF